MSYAPLWKKLASTRKSIFEKIAQQEYKDRIRTNTDEVMERGGYGTPTMFVNGSMFFGNDRLVLGRRRVEAKLVKKNRQKAKGVSCQF